MSQEQNTATTTDLGMVTAYGYAKDGGYTGTAAQFGPELAAALANRPPAPAAADALKVPAVTTAGAYALEHRVKDVTSGGVSLRGSDDIVELGSLLAYVYGVDVDTSVQPCGQAAKRVVLDTVQDLSSSTGAFRYRQVDEFDSMPCHNLRRCVVDDLSTRHVNYYLSATDSNYKSDGATASVLTGADGDVMVEVPLAYWRTDTYTDADGHVHFVHLLSQSSFRNSAPHPCFYISPGGSTARTQYIGAFRSVLCNADGSVKDQGAGTSPATYTAGDKYRSIAGARPASAASRASFRTGASVSGGTNINWLMQSYLGLLMLVEHATMDVQSGFSCGYTNLSGWAYASMRSTGRTAQFGNGSGSVLADDTGDDADLLTMKSGGTTLWASGLEASQKVVQCSYRGVEDPFGCMWCLDDGIQKIQNATDLTQSGYHFTTDTASYSLLDSDLEAGEDGVAFPSCGYTGTGTLWVSHHWPKSTGYAASWDKTTLLPLSAGGSSSTYMADSIWNDSTAGTRLLFRGGLPHSGAAAGMWCMRLDNGLSSAYASFGCRIAC